ncbi:zinc finger domain-containing protein [Streptomyces cavernicola]|uniref:DNA-binding phage zinc finger domain-containing protein n=1 Tax=Streptomyces cavernicola TaxID=3043613 RepID=A0ABT6SJD4_9ACTN|nr:hypothetical protein [Streptomyces sp. B-S-A6]MDI3408306.1 hypothetical protein [Streptomyces sp. B-S-A6]
MSVPCPRCLAAEGEPCDGDVVVHYERHRLLMERLGPAAHGNRFQSKITAEHEDGSRCPDTGPRRHRQRPLDPQCPGRVFFRATCRECRWTCRKERRKDAQAAGELHAQFCWDQYRSMDPRERAAQREAQRVQNVIKVACPVCDADVGVHCRDTRGRRPRPYIHWDGSPRVHLKRSAAAPHYGHPLPYP